MFASFETFQKNMLMSPEYEASRSKRVVYVKTHKTASSTVTGVLWRELCIKHHRNCFAPDTIHPGRTWRLDSAPQRRYIDRAVGTNLTTKPFDAWVHHVAFPWDQLSSVVVKPHIWMSSVRRPSLRLRSAWDFFAVAQTRNLTLPQLVALVKTNTSAASIDADHLEVLTRLADYPGPVTDPMAGASAAARGTFARAAGSRAFFRKQFARDTCCLDGVAIELAGPSVSPLDERFMRLCAQVLDFEVLLLVADRFDESLLVMSWVLQWGPDALDALVYFPQKVRGAGSNATALGERDLRLLDALQPRDLLLYRLATAALDQLARFYGEERLARDLAELQRRRARVHESCAATGVVGVSAAAPNPYPLLVSQPATAAFAAASVEQRTLHCAYLRLDNVPLVDFFWRYIESGAIYRGADFANATRVDIHEMGLLMRGVQRDRVITFPRSAHVPDGLKRLPAARSVISSP